MKKLFSIGALMLVILVGGIMSGCSNGKGKSEFCYETVIVQLTQEKSAVLHSERRVLTIDDFPEIDLVEARHLTGGGGSVDGVPMIELYWTRSDCKCFYVLTLEKPGRDNVLKAVYELNKRSDVYRASLSHVFYGT